MRFTSLLLILFLSINCKSKNNSNDVDEQTIENQQIIELLQEWYLWNDQIEDNLNAEDFSSPQDVLNQLRYSTLDRWSNISDATRFTTYYEEGTYLGYGFSYDQDQEGNIRFRFTYNDSPFGKAGIQRGWKLLKIDNQDVQNITDWANVFGENQLGYTQTFQVEDLEGNQKEYQIAKDIVTINSVLYSDTLNFGTETVGYLVFNNFINPAKEELDDVFDLFQSANIERVILDLRYNGGGQVSVAEYLANYLIQTDDNGVPFYKLAHNIDRSADDQVYSLSKKGTINIRELIVLTTDATASASELMLNGLNPLMMLTHIGEGNTYGKPVGSYGWYSLDRTNVYSLISFRLLNSRNEGDFFEGIKPDYSVCDDISKPFGAFDENLLAAAIEYIQTGKASECALYTKARFKPLLPQEEPGPTLILNH